MHSISRRFGTNLLGNIIKAIFVFITGLMIARVLGPEDYGYYVFLLASFASVRVLTDMGSSNAFFTFVSKEPRERNFYSYYLFWITAQFLVPLIVIANLPSAWLVNVWKGDELGLILAAFSASFMQYTLWGFIAQLGESQRLTQRVQLLNIVIAVAHFTVVLLFLTLGYKDIMYLYSFTALEFLLAFAFVISSWPSKVVFKHKNQRISFKREFNEFSKYCAPLLPFTWVSVAYIFADAWLLQHYAGSVQQAYFAVALQVAAVSLVATTSILRILWKEIAEAAHRGNLDRVKLLYNNACRWLFFFAAMISGFLAPWASDIVYIFLGEKYMAGVATLTLMFFYPVHQALGQITSSVYLALEKTKPYAFIITGGMLVSISVTYFILVPSEIGVIGWGLGLGAFGMALKMVFLQIFSVNLMILVLCRMQGWPYQFIYQVKILFITIVLGYISYYVFSVAFRWEEYLVFSFVCSGLLYLVFLTVVVWNFSYPLLGISKTTLLNLKAQVIRRLRL